MILILRCVLVKLSVVNKELFKEDLYKMRFNNIIEVITLRRGELGN